MRTLPFFKPKNKPQFAGLNVSDASSGGGGGDTLSLVNKSDITPIILIGTTNTSGNVISAGTWFYLNGKPCIAKVDIASGATFTKDTNYEEKTVGSALSELNSKSATYTDSVYVQLSDINKFNYRSVVFEDYIPSNATIISCEIISDWAWSLPVISTVGIQNNHFVIWYAWWSSESQQTVTFTITIHYK